MGKSTLRRNSGEKIKSHFYHIPMLVHKTNVKKLGKSPWEVALDGGPGGEQSQGSGREGAREGNWHSNL